MGNLQDLGIDEALDMPFSTHITVVNQVIHPVILGNA